MSGERVRVLFASILRAFLAACSQPAGRARASVILAADPAPKLSDYGFFATTNAGRCACRRRRALRPRSMRCSADYAAKHRFVYVPKGEHATYNPDKVFDFPVGSVLIKTFAVRARHARSGIQRALHRDASSDPQARRLGRLSLHLEQGADRGGLFARRRRPEDRDDLAGRKAAVDRLCGAQPQPVQGMPLGQDEDVRSDRSARAQPQSCRPRRREPARRTGWSVAS